MIVGAEGLDIHHVGLVMPDMAHVETFMALLGLAEDTRGYVADFRCWCVFAAARGGTTLEFVVPDGGPLANFNKGRPGLHHIAIVVPDIDAVRARLDEEGIPLLADGKVQGAGPFFCNFISPVDTRGIQIELIELQAGAAVSR